MATKVMVTGAGGFVGRHLLEALHRRTNTEVIPVGKMTVPALLDAGLQQADVILHAAGVNRPTDPAEFETGNAEFTRTLCKRLQALGRRPTIVMTSSIQAEFDNPYGRSKLAAERALEDWAERGGGRAVIFRLKNVFGKWCRPNYNSVTATFCQAVAHDLPFTISDEKRVLELVYIDDVVAAVLDCLRHAPGTGIERRDVSRSVSVALGELAQTIRSFKASRQNLRLPSFETEFVRRLYATYLSYLDGPDFSYALEQKTDPRGSLAEFMKSAQFGQLFVSRTKPGVTRGNHYHHTKTEKFLVVEGDALVRFRPIEGADIIEHRVSGTQFRVVDIPPGYTHSIQNVGTGELVTLFWASEIFDPAAPDTYFTPVQK